jgi:hypothetical protein
VVQTPATPAPPTPAPAGAIRVAAPTTVPAAPAPVAPARAVQAGPVLPPPAAATPSTPAPLKQTSGSAAGTSVVPVLTPLPTPAAQPVQPAVVQASPPVIRIPARAQPANQAPAAQPSPPLTPRTPTDLSPRQVQQLVAKAGGKLIRQIRVEKGADQRLTVHVHAAPAIEQELITRLLQVPQIAASNIHLQIHLAP